jgi:hypothetical protein
VKQNKSTSSRYYHGRVGVVGRIVDVGVPSILGDCNRYTASVVMIIGTEPSIAKKQAVAVM